MLFVVGNLPPIKEPESWKINEATGTQKNRLQFIDLDEGALR